MKTLQIGKKYKAKHNGMLWEVDYIGCVYASIHNEHGGIQVVNHRGMPALSSTTELDLEPEPQYRPWTESEVPVGAILRYKNNAQSVRLLIQRSSEKGMGGPDTNLAYSFILDRMEHSLTGINGPWLPCGVLIQ